MGIFFSKPTNLPFQEALATITLNNPQMAVFHHRYIPLVHNLKHRSHRLAVCFHASRGIVTIGSLLVPALLSIQYDSSTGSTSQYNLYWFTWSVSLIVTMCNGMFTLLKLDKRYYLVHTTLEQTISEGWQYIELSGKYSGFYTPGSPPNHENQFKYFCHAVEKIRMSQVEQEYYKLTDGNTGGSTQLNSVAVPTTSITAEDKLHAFVPPTPLKDELAKLPTEVVKAVNTQLSQLLSDRDDISGSVTESREPGT